MSSVKNPVIRTDLSGIQEHVDAMLAAETPSAAASVLHSALKLHHLGGIRLTCDVHPSRDMDFAKLLVHCRTHHHAPGDVRPADPDPIEARRLGGDA